MNHRQSYISVFRLISSKREFLIIANSYMGWHIVDSVDNIGWNFIVPFYLVNQVSKWKIIYYY